ncbi:hypothetical protein BS623_08760 [Vibrio parahaemolyticus]|nr:hypothetical protein BS623_08760 [Vibrio parahaemolyticus]OUJ45354.1 hypothetical protein BTZ53_12935 [Vibrio parahaemolyticus]
MIAFVMSRKNFLKNVTWSLSDKLLRLLLGIVISAAIARHLGVDAFGALNFSITVLSILTIITSFGFNKIITREVSSNSRDSSLIVEGLFIFRVLISLISFFLTIIILLLFFSIDYIYIVIVLFSLFPLSFDVFDFSEQGRNGFKKISLIRTFSFLSSSVIRLFFIYIGLDFSFFVVAIVLEHTITAVLLYYFVLKKDYKELKVRFTSLEKVKPIILESFPEMLAGLFGILFMKMDQLLISYYYGKYELGIYTAATRLTEAWYFIPTAILAVVLPKINRIKIDKGDYTSAIESSISILVFIAIIVSIFFNLFSDLIVQVIFGEEYFSSSKIIVIHVWSSVFLCMGLASGTYLILEGKLKYSLYRNLLGVITSFAFGLVLIPKLGIEGAAYSTLAGMVSAFFIFDVFVRELRGLFIFKLKSLFVYKAISFLYSYLRLR